MYDGFGTDYFEQSHLPVMKDMARQGVMKRGRAIIPTLTNANNISICCAAWPAEHGVTTNCYFDEETGTARFLEDAKFILTPTIFRRFREKGIRSALLTCKAKTLHLIGGDADIAVAAESPLPELIEQYGPPPPMYSTEVNYWLWKIAIDILASRPEIGLLYVHTTDYPMHMWGPGELPSLTHMAHLDRLLGEARRVAADALFMITADHGMNPKKRCIDLRKSCAQNGIQLRFSVSPVADRLVKHHLGFGGVSYVYVRSAEELPFVQAYLSTLNGVDEVLQRHEAAIRYHLMPERIGDLVVLADIDTVFGDLDGPSKELDTGYRSHGSAYEDDVPLILYGYDGKLPRASDLTMNFDLTRWLCRTAL